MVRGAREFFMDDTDMVVIKLKPREMMKFKFIFADGIVDGEVDPVEIWEIK